MDWETGDFKKGPFDFEREFEDAGNYPGDHYTRDCESAIIIWGDGEDDYWRIESITDGQAKFIVDALNAFTKKEAPNG
jgi:hypothetical protein